MQHDFKGSCTSYCSLVWNTVVFWSTLCSFLEYTPVCSGALDVPEGQSRLAVYPVRLRLPVPLAAWLLRAAVVLLEGVSASVVQLVELDLCADHHPPGQESVNIQYLGTVSTGYYFTVSLPLPRRPTIHGATALSGLARPVGCPFRRWASVVGVPIRVACA